MRILKNKTFKNYLLIFLVTFSIEIIFRLLGHLPILDIAILRIFIGTNIISLLLGVIFSFGERRIGNLLSFIFSILISFYAFLQIALKNYFYNYLSFNVLDMVKPYSKNIINCLEFKYYIIFLPVLCLALYYLIFERKVSISLKNQKYNVMNILGGEKATLEEKERIKKSNKETLKDTRIILSIVLVSFSILYVYLFKAKFMQSELQVEKNSELITNPDMSIFTMNKFGVLGSIVIDGKNIIFPSKESVSLLNEYTKPNQEIDNYTRYINDSLWEEKSQKETDIGYKTLNNYYMSKKITPKNDYTGMFKGKNLLMISISSLSNDILALPNTSRLLNEGWFFENNYNVSNSLETDYSSLLGILTYNDRNFNYQYSLFDLFKKSNYETSIYVNKDDFRENLNAKIYEEDNDEILVDKLIADIKEEDYFMKYISLNSLNIPCRKNEYNNNLNKIDGLIGKVYENIDNKTIVVLLSDHGAYGFENEEKLPLIIYSSDIRATNYKKYTSNLDVLPTLANLFNLEYDPRIYFGEDVFSDDYNNIVLFRDGSWISDKGRYISYLGRMEYFKDDEYKNEEIVAFNRVFMDNIKMSRLAAQKNYYNYLGDVK